MANQTRFAGGNVFAPYQTCLTKQNSLKGAHHCSRISCNRPRSTPRRAEVSSADGDRSLSSPLACYDRCGRGGATLRLAPLLLCRMRLAALHVYRFGKGLAFASCADGCRASSRYGWDLSLLPLSCFCLALGRSSMCKDTSLCQVFDAQRGRFASARAPGTSV